MSEPFTDPRMRPRQGVEGNRRVEMVLGMIGHVPHQKTHRPPGQGRPRVGQAIGILAAPGVLGKGNRPQDRLAEEGR